MKITTNIMRLRHRAVASNDQSRLYTSHTPMITRACKMVVNIHPATCFFRCLMGDIHIDLMKMTTRMVNTPSTSMRKMKARSGVDHECLKSSHPPSSSTSPYNRNMMMDRDDVLIKAPQSTAPTHATKRLNRYLMDSMSGTPAYECFESVSM